MLMNGQRQRDHIALSDPHLVLTKTRRSPRHGSGSHEAFYRGICFDDTKAQDKGVKADNELLSLCV
jgi:hypothetical protein